MIDILVNKDNPLNKDYTPKDLIITDENSFNYHKFLDPLHKPSVREEVYFAFKELQKQGLKDGIFVIVDSGFRSYDYQQQIWDYNVETKGLEHTKKYVALPGTSEHQTGLAIDLGAYINKQYTDDINENTEEYKWMIENAHKYGFILRYPKGKEDITGINFEPWHYRYVGYYLANELHDKDMTLEEHYTKKKVLKL